MKVILNQDITNLGEEGDIKDVARGYARNYLIPKRMVMPYTREALAMLESRREAIEHRREEKRKAATDIKTRLETEPLEIEMPAGDRGRLFGSVTSANVADALAARGIDVERRRIDIPDKTIKNVGTTYVRVRLYGDQEAELRVDVKATGGAAQSAPSAEPEAAPSAEPEAAPSAEPETAEPGQTDDEVVESAAGEGESDGDEEE
ncbi:MAG: 50S ribosomal protein L9 [Spirochaetota bacterium]